MGTRFAHQTCTDMRGLEELLRTADEKSDTALMMGANRCGAVKVTMNENSNGGGFDCDFHSYEPRDFSVDASGLATTYLAGAKNNFKQIQDGSTATGTCG